MAEDDTRRSRDLDGVVTAPGNHSTEAWAGEFLARQIVDLASDTGCDLVVVHGIRTYLPGGRRSCVSSSTGARFR